MAGVVAAAVIIFGPLSSLVIWSFAEKWYWPHLFPQQVGFFYWAKVLQGDMLRALTDGFLIAIVVTVLTLLITIPLAYVLARLPDSLQAPDPHGLPPAPGVSTAAGVRELHDAPLPGEPGREAGGGGADPHGGARWSSRCGR